MTISESEEAFFSSISGRRSEIREPTYAEAESLSEVAAKFFSFRQHVAFHAILTVGSHCWPF